MNEKYLVGLDGSDCGERAVVAALQQAKISGASIVLCYVIPWSPFTFSTAEENALRHKRREDELARASELLLTPEKKRFEAHGIACEIVARHGHPAKTLAQLAREHQVSMIIVGVLGDTPLKSRFLGGTASTLIQISPCPVLVVP
ncbi:MAG: universal stress protein [Wenzhouxiangella sp.]|nr:MAG: universal stress protein [Wenzhouxiangella sp.]